MPKMKTSRAAAKRFKTTGTGKLVRSKAYKSHILTKKSTKRKKSFSSCWRSSSTSTACIRSLIWLPHTALPSALTLLVFCWRFF